MILALSFVIGSCPLWCATFEAGIDAPCSRSGLHVAHEREPMTPLPVNDDDCVCNGAIVAVASPPTVGLDPSFSPSDLDGAHFIGCVAVLVASRDGTACKATVEPHGGRCALVVNGPRMRC